MRALAALVPALALLASVPAAADPSIEPLSWLQRAAASAREGNYAGTIMHVQGERTSTSRLTHLVLAGIERERIESMDGPRREVVRNGDQLQCFYPDAKTVRIDRRVTARFFPAHFSGPVEAITEGYKLRLGGVERVADKDCQWIHLDPRDALRYAQQLCAELGTGLLLKAKTLGAKNQVLEQYAFTELRLGAEVSKRELRSTFLPQSRNWRRDEQPLATPVPGATGWVVSALPPGYRLVGEMQRTMPNRPGPVTQLVVADGFASMSVFVEPLAEKPRSGEATSEDGSLSVFARPVGEYLVTVLGEVPPAAAQQVGRSVVRQAR